MDFHSNVTCPHCGAPEHCRGAGVTIWACGSGSDGMRGWNCERWVALRVSQLKRMIDLLWLRAREVVAGDARTPGADVRRRQARRSGWYLVLRASCSREIDRLRGQG